LYVLDDTSNLILQYTKQFQREKINSNFWILGWAKASSKFTFQKLLLFF